MNIKVYQSDIKKLLQLKAKDKTGYKKFYAELQKKYGKNYKQILRDLNKLKEGQTPGIRAKRSDADKEKRPPSKKQAKTYMELVKGGKSKTDARKMTEKITGQKLSYHQERKLQDDLVGDEIPETTFGSEAKKFISKLFELNLIAPDKGLKHKFKSVTLFIQKPDLEAIRNILATVYNRHVEGKDHITVDRNALLREEMFYSAAEFRRLADERGDVKMLEACSRIQARLDPNRKVELPNDFTAFLHAMKKLKADITREEAVDLLMESCDELNMD